MLSCLLHHCTGADERELAPAVPAVLLSLLLLLLLLNLQVPADLAEDAFTTWLPDNASLAEAGDIKTWRNRAPEAFAKRFAALRAELPESKASWLPAAV
jgi:hypothetical protein